MMCSGSNSSSSKAVEMGQKLLILSPSAFSEVTLWPLFTLEISLIVLTHIYLQTVKLADDDLPAASS
jgi:hypothetical protein